MFVTGVVDVRAGRLLDVVEGRSAIASWPLDRPLDTPESAP